MFTEYVANSIVTYHTHVLQSDSSESQKGECSSKTLQLGSVVVYQSDVHVFEKIARIFEREITILERNQLWVDTLLAVISSREFIGMCLLLFVSVAVFVFGRSHGNRDIPVRPRASPHRAIQCRGGGTLTRADGTL